MGEGGGGNAAPEWKMADHHITKFIQWAWQDIVSPIILETSEVVQDPVQLLT